jgi:hypothetical protein
MPWGGLRPARLALTRTQLGSLNSECRRVAVADFAAVVLTDGRRLDEGMDLAGAESWSGAIFNSVCQIRLATAQLMRDSAISYRVSGAVNAIREAAHRWHISIPRPSL